MTTRLRASAAGWTRRADVVVVGSGVAGLTTALDLAAAGLAVVVVTKDVVAAGSTQWAQGGVAAALGVDDSPDEHLADTLVAGAGLCDEAAVRVLVDEGPAAVRELMARGARFDRTRDGELSLTLEGGHHRRRIAHAGGDATGAEVQRSLVTRLRDSTVEIIEHALVLDLLRSASGAVAGVTLHVMAEGARDGVGALYAPAVVLATGGIGQVYTSTTNPAVSTGDGVAVALRAGAVVRDLEFVQFHPTVLWTGRRSLGQQPLISEAVRGEGAVLVDDAGDPVMTGVHELGDLAPRDVVAKAIVRRMRATGAEHVWLDGRAFGDEKWRVRFPTIHAALAVQGIDPARSLIPVVPAAHYSAGGVRTDLHGRTSVPGLYAAGEVSCTGVHGANRLASNSLLEGLVFARRIARMVPQELGTMDDVVNDHPRVLPLLDGAQRGSVQEICTARAGVLRHADGLASAAAELAALPRHGAAGVAAWETTDLLMVAQALVRAATVRQETRGSHWREDFPDPDDAWRGHIEVTLDDAGDGLHTTFVTQGMMSA